MREYNIICYPFDDIYNLLNDANGRKDIIKHVENIAEQLFHPEATDDSPDRLKDQIEYRDLILRNYNIYPNFGRVFLAFDKSTKVCAGFMLCFDDLNISEKAKPGERFPANKSKFPIVHCNAYFQHDIPYLTDLAILRGFSYCFQIGVPPDYQGENCADELLNAFELYYTCNNKSKEIVLLAASIHERQKKIMWRIQKRNTELTRHKGHHKNNLDFTYHFLDHYFDEKEEERHWFRVVQIPNNRAFIRKINYLNLPKAYNTLIPIQLNQASIGVNKIIKHLGAKLVWSSLFNANNLLLNRYGMNKDNHGFFSSLLDSSPNQYDNCASSIRKITQYLKDKTSPRTEVASLTESFREESYEIFFFKEEPHEMHSFNNVLSISLENIEKATDKLLDFLKNEVESSSIYRYLTEKEKTAWLIALKNVIKKPEDEKNQANWEKWKKFLSLSDEDEAMLSVWVSAVMLPESREAQYNREGYIAGKEILRRINNKQKVLASTTRQQWVDFMKLHNTLYDIDAYAMDNSDDYWWCHAMVPISYSQRKNVVGIMFSFKCKKLSKNIEGASTRMNDLAHLIASALSKNMLNILIKFQENYAIENGHRFAIAAVTSRNLAHNLGSHILANLDNRVGIRNLRMSMPSSFDTELAKFNSFIRTKTHHLADMVTSEPVSTVSKWLKMEVIKSFNEQKIVKKFLSGTKVSKINIHFRDKNGSDKEDIKVQIPNSDLGVAAFSMILENIIRNSAKYELPPDCSNLNITVEVDSEEDRGYTLKIYDHIPREPKNLKTLIYDINEMLNVKSFLTDNHIRPSGWGLTEMKAAAAYLRKKIPGVALGREEELTIPFITAKKHRIPKEYATIDETAYTLAYEIYLKRPRNILIVNDEQVFNSVPQKRLTTYGIKLISANSISVKEKDIYSHDFIVYYDNSSKKNIENLQRFPLRWIKLNGIKEAEQLRDYLNKMTGDELLNYIWERWLRGYCSRKNINYHDLSLSILTDKHSNSIDSKKTPQHLLVYDDHGRNLPDLLTDRKSNLHFYHSYSSVDPLGRIINNNSSLHLEQQKTFRYQLFETAITRIAVIDERIQRDSIKLSQQVKYDVFEKLRQMLIYIPDPKQGEPDLLQMKTQEKLEHWINELLSNHKFDFIILHLGLIESLVSAKMEAIDQWIENKIRQIDIRPEVILISGRGKPHHFPSSIRFQPANVISEYLTEENLSKYHLVQILFSSRTRVGA